MTPYRAENHIPMDRVFMSYTLETSRVLCGSGTSMLVLDHNELKKKTMCFDMSRQLGLSKYAQYPNNTTPSYCFHPLSILHHTLCQFEIFPTVIMPLFRRPYLSWFGGGGLEWRRLSCSSRSLLLSLKLLHGLHKLLAKAFTWGYTYKSSHFPLYALPRPKLCIYASPCTQTLPHILLFLAGKPS
jgi:hypothetical protein